MKLTEAEWQLMNALWGQYPASAREIARRLPAEKTWAYTTIKTMLTRLVEKKAVSETKDANTSIYEPILSREKARRSALAALVNQAFDGALGPLVHFLVEEQGLSGKERREMIRLLQNRTQEKGKRQ